MTTSTTFVGILFEMPQYRANDDLPEPDFFGDLNLDQVVASVTAGREEYGLTPFFYRPLPTESAVQYRHEIFRDLGDSAVFEHVESFAQGMHDMRRQLALATRLHYQRQKERWLLEAVNTYCDTIERFTADLASAQVNSRGLTSFREYLAGYAASDTFANLAARTRRLLADLDEIKYCLHIAANRITVTRYASETDYSAEVAVTFEKFQRGQANNHYTKFRETAEMNHVEAGVLDRVAMLYPEVFASLAAFWQLRDNFLDDTVGTFDREVQFYVAYLAFMQRLTTTGLTFSYPEVSRESKEVSAYDTFDIALADKLGSTGSVVCNDVYLRGKERIFVVSGPNQGGKTTFARTFGQLHYLAKLGCPVPGRETKLFLYDELFCHFEREEVQDLSGKLENDLVRIHAILAKCTPDSVVIMNEIFNSTTLTDAIFLGTEVLRRLIEFDLLCVCVTFVDELACLGDTVVSVASTVVPENPAERTFKVVRRPADGVAYAVAIAEKYGLTYRKLKERLTS